MEKLFGKNIVYLDEVDSTQDYIKEYKEPCNGMVVCAESQTHGRGTNGRSWQSEKEKNLMFSILLMPNCKLDRIKDLTVIIAKTVIKTIYDLYGYKLDIKKPNDVMLNGKKMCGILTESTTSKNIVKKIIIGIGMNINQTNFEGELAEIATSLKKEFNKDFDKNEILTAFLTEFEKEYLKII